MKELVSIMIPVYNAQKYLYKCLNSICNQTYKNIEIIVVDDGSSDTSGKICDEFGYWDTRIKVIHQTHLGVAAARNVALSHACGNFFCFVDADDYIDTNMISRMYSLMVEHECDIIQCKYLRVEDSFEDILPNTINEVDLNIYTTEEALWRLQAGKNRISMMLWNKLYRREIWDGIICHVGKIYEDDAVMHRLLAKANRVGSIEEILYYQRMSPDSIIRAGFSFNKYDFIDAMLDRFNFFLDIGDMECAYITVHKLAVKIIELYRETIHFYPNELDRLKYLLTLYRDYWNVLRESPFLSDSLRHKHKIWLDTPEKGELYAFTDYSCMLERNYRKD